METPLSSARLSRRAFFAAMPMVPNFMGRESFPAQTDPKAYAEQWLAVDREINRLTMRWQDLETWLAAEHNWFSLSEQESAELIEAKEMREIDVRIPELSAQRDWLFKALMVQPSTTLQDVTSKLAIATQIACPYDNRNVHDLLAIILSEISHFL